MTKMQISLGERSYPIYITEDYSGLAKALAGTGVLGKVVMITDTNVDRAQADECMHALQGLDSDISKYVIPAGEASKNLDTIKGIYQHLIDLKMDRNGILIALGGGVVGDITGFAAATFLRGVKFVQIPTSLLAQADSSVGGKVGVDFMGSKNIIGAFYQPRFVYIHVNTLKTLPLRELRAGLAEVVKHGVIRDKDFFEYLNYNVNKIFQYDVNTLKYIAKMNCSIKGKVVEKDEKESGIREILNFGHTFGHAIESVSNFEMLHGECVSVGMIAAFKMAEALQMVDEAQTIEVRELLLKIGLPVSVKGLDKEKIFRQMFFDKKIKGSKLTFILPKRIGEVYQCVVEDEALIRKVIDEIVL